MEFQNVGKHCSDPTCKQKDFLPFTCKNCTKIYCLDHRATSAHNCPRANAGDTKVLRCPDCSKTLTFDGGALTEDDYWSIHHATDCRPEEFRAAQQENIILCRAKGCKAKLTPLNSHMCRGCRKKLCLKHRYEDQHDCFYEPEPVQQVRNVAPQSKPAPIQSQINKPQNTYVNSQTAPKLQQQQQRTDCAQQHNSEICSVCGKGFANLDDLIRHAEQTHF